MVYPTLIFSMKTTYTKGNPLSSKSLLRKLKVFRLIQYPTDPSVLEVFAQCEYDIHKTKTTLNVR